jgi:PAS domain S-box-containing protein
VIANSDVTVGASEKEQRSDQCVPAVSQRVTEIQENKKPSEPLPVVNSHDDFKHEAIYKGQSNPPAFTNEDTTERKKDEEYIGHLAAIVESSDNAIISKTLDGVIKSWNMGAQKIFGYTSIEAIGKHISFIIPTEYLEEERMILVKVRNDEIVDNYETVRLKKNGDRFHISLTVSPLKNRSGNIIGVSKIASDITARKRSEASLIRLNKELIFQNEEKGKRAAELLIANNELIFQNEEKEKRAAELIIAS